MTLRVVGAGLPRSGTHSLKLALEHLLGEPCFHMREIPGHPYDCGPLWSVALRGAGRPEWERIFEGYAAAVDWPAGLFWREISQVYPDALILLSTRDSAETWLASMEATILPVARAIAPQDWLGGRDLAVMLERFVGTTEWDDRDLLLAARDRWIADVCDSTDPARLIEWRPGQGWGPLCHALGVPVPDRPFPWANRREDWVY